MLLAQGSAAMRTGDWRYEVQHGCQQAGDAQEDDEQGRPNDPALELAHRHLAHTHSPSLLMGQVCEVGKIRGKMLRPLLIGITHDKSGPLSDAYFAGVPLALSR